MTDATDTTAVPIRTLRDVAVSWARPQPRDTPDEVHVDPALIRTVGRVGATVYTDNGTQPVISDIDPAAILTATARRIGPTRFAAMTGLALRTAKRIATGGHARPATIARVLAALDTPTIAGLLDQVPTRGCDHCGNPLNPRQRRWCCAQCKHRAARTPTNTRRAPREWSTPGGTEKNASREIRADD